MKLVLLLLAVSLGCERIHPQESAPVEHGQKTTLRIGPNIPIASRFRNLPVVEPHLSIHPQNNERLLVSAMIVTDPARPYESCRLTTFVSLDGGTSWKETVHDYWGYDPWSAILPDGHTVLSWIGTPGSFQDKYPIVFFTSPDGGSTWSRDVQVLPGNHDGTKLTAAQDTVYFTTTFFADNMDSEVRLYSSEQKSAFRMRAAIDNQGEHVGFAQAAILPNGMAIVPLSINRKYAWVQIFSPQNESFSQPVVISPKIGERKGYFHLVADTGSSAYGGRLYFVRAAGREGTFEGIFVNVSEDGGRSWSEDRRVDVFPGGGKSRAFLPAIAVNHEGIVGVSWVDNRSAASGTMNDIYFAISTDGGRTFEQPVRVTDTSSDPRTSINDDVANKFPGGGHYQGLAARKDGSFQLVWSDSRHGHFQLYTSNIQRKPPTK